MPWFTAQEQKPSAHERRSSARERRPIAPERRPTLPRLRVSDPTRCVRLGKDHLDEKYFRDDVCLTRRQIQSILTDLVLDASVIFEAYNITHFLDSGTLLGSYRDGAVIPHDLDADMGINERSFEFIQKNPIIVPPKYSLHVFGSEIHDGGSRDKELPVRVVHKESALYMDVFVYIDAYKPTEGKVTGPIPSLCFSDCRSCPQIGRRKWQFQVPHDWIYPPQSCSFGHRALKCPAKTEKYLRYMFGDNFMTPVYEYYR